MEYKSHVPAKRQLYVMVENFRYGPYTVETLQLYISSGQISKKCLVCEDGDDEWIPIRNMPEFQDAAVPLPPPPPTPVAINTRQLRQMSREAMKKPGPKPIRITPETAEKPRRKSWLQSLVRLFKKNKKSGS